MTFTTHPNQRTIIINREIPKKTKEDKRPYMIAYLNNLAAAGKDLNGVAFKLYCYFLGNEDRYNLAFSPKDFTNNYGGSVRAAQIAFKELEDKGYIWLDKGNTFHFNELPVPQRSAANEVETIPTTNIASTIIPSPATTINREISLMDKYNLR